MRASSAFSSLVMWVQALILQRYRSLPVVVEGPVGPAAGAGGAAAAAAEGPVGPVLAAAVAAGSAKVTCLCDCPPVEVVPGLALGVMVGGAFSGAFVCRVAECGLATCVAWSACRSGLGW